MSSLWTFTDYIQHIWMTPPAALPLTAHTAHYACTTIHLLSAILAWFWKTWAIRSWPYPDTLSQSWSPLMRQRCLKWWFKKKIVRCAAKQAAYDDKLKKSFGTAPLAVREDPPQPQKRGEAMSDDQTLFVLEWMNLNCRLVIRCVVPLFITNIAVMSHDHVVSWIHCSVTQ